jgi:hypothetical protein
MTEEGIFPTTLSGKSEYYNRAVPYCDTNKVRLVIDPAKIADRVLNLTDWNDVYPKSIDKNQTTKTLRDGRDDLIPVIEDGMRDIYDDIPASKLTDADRNTLNLKKRDTVKTPRPKISDTAFVKVMGKPGALMQFTCRTNNDSSRASIHPDADGIEIVYNIGGTEPVSAKECTTTITSTKAKFQLQLDNSDSGKKFYGFARWKNNTDSNKSSPWVAISGMVSA